MASNILNVLENVEKGRQNCIKNAKLANLPATDDMDIFINPNNPEVGGGWQRPNDWWDTEDIIRNAQDIEQDGVTYHPTYIMLLPNTDISTTMSKTASGNASQGDAFVFSDEPDTLYVGNQTHTWDVSKDKPCSLGYSTRYVIVYMINAELNANIDFKTDVKVMEMIVDKLTVPTSSSKQIIIQSNKYILNFKCTENTNMTTISSSTFSSCYSLTSINLPALTTISSSTFSSCSSLVSFLFYNTFTSLLQPQQFTGCVNLKDLQLVSNWRWSLNVKDTDLTHECIIDMFNKLKDLTGEDSLTLTIGATNLAKVTDEELQIPNSKNWTVQ